MKSNSFPNKSSGARKKTARLRRRQKEDGLEIVKLFLAFGLFLALFVLHFTVLLAVIALLGFVLVLRLIFGLVLGIGHKKAPFEW